MTEKRIKEFKKFRQIINLWVLAWLYVFIIPFSIFFILYEVVYGYLIVSLIFAVLALMPFFYILKKLLKMNKINNYSTSKYNELSYEYYGYLKSLRRGEVKMNYKLNESDSIKNKLEDLKDLLDQNIITQEEYDIKRKKIIDNY